MRVRGEFIVIFTILYLVFISIPRIGLTPHPVLHHLFSKLINLSISLSFRPICYSIETCRHARRREARELDEPCRRLGANGPPSRLQTVSGADACGSRKCDFLGGPFAQSVTCCRPTLLSSYPPPHLVLPFTSLRLCRGSEGAAAHVHAPVAGQRCQLFPRAGGCEGREKGGGGGGRKGVRRWSL